MHVGRDHCSNNGDGTQEGLSGRRCYSEGHFSGKRRRVLRSARHRPGRSYARTIVAGTRTSCRECSAARFSRDRTAAFSGDLTTIVSMQRLHPRSPYEKLGGYVHLPRLIDKARLHRKGLLNGYNYKTVGFDKHLLAFLKLDGDAFEEI